MVYVVHMYDVRYEELLDVSVPKPKQLQMHTSAGYVILCTHRVSCCKFLSQFCSTFVAIILYFAFHKVV